jgi:hypothetical protein
VSAVLKRMGCGGCGTCGGCAALAGGFDKAAGVPLGFLLNETFNLAHALVGGSVVLVVAVADASAAVDDDEEDG